jgi:hypothetical protein
MTTLLLILVVATLEVAAVFYLVHAVARTRWFQWGFASTSFRTINHRQRRS